MTLKNLIEADNRQVFLNLNEFAEWVEVDGVLMKCQVQYHTEKASTLKTETFDTLHGDYVKIFFRTADYCGKRERSCESW